MSLLRPLVLMLMLFVGMSVVQAQEHISHYFDLEQEFTLPSESSLHHQGKVIGCIDGNLLYLCNAEVLQTRKKGCELTLEVCDLLSSETRSVTLTLPEKRGLGSQRYWIYAIDVVGDRVLLTTHSQLFEFVLRQDGKGRLVQTVDFPDADFVLGQKDDVYAVSQVNDYGFVLRKLNKGRLDSIAGFPLPAPFMLQFGPNGFLKATDSALFFVTAPYAALQRFNLRGEKTGELQLEVEGWNEMPQDYIESVGKMPYSGDRAIHIFNTSTTYSFPLELFPMNDTTFLLSYHQYNSERNKFDIRFLWVKLNKNWKMLEQKELQSKFDAAHVLQDGEFPFSYADRSLVRMLTSQERIVQVVKTSGAPYVGKTQQECEEEQEKFFAKNAPLLQVRVFHTKNHLPRMKCSDIGFCNYEGLPFSVDRIPTRYAIILVNNPPQCHACEDELRRYLNTLPFETSSLYVVDAKVSDFLGKKECEEKNRTSMHVPCKSLFVPREAMDTFPQLFAEMEFPLLLLYDKKSSTMMVLSGTDLFPADPLKPGLQDEAVRLLHWFGR